MKKKYYFLFLFFISLTAFSQLTVRNTAFVFAKDVVLFVEDDVNLKEPAARLYLRNESQLIQGGGSTGNSGQGQLSVYQEGTVNEYAYNYWCSPVGNTDADNIGNRAFRANNQFYDVITEPITSVLAGYNTPGYNGIASPLNISPRWLYKFNAGEFYNEWDYIGSTGTVDPGYGFSMKGTNGGDQRYDFRGKPNKGNITTTVVAGKETLVGNPFPAALDARDYIHDLSNGAIGGLYFWEHDASINSHYVADYVGGYASYTVSAGGSVLFIPATFDTYDGAGTKTSTGSPSTTGKLVGRYIPIGQGFMIKGLTNGAVTVKNSHTKFEKETGGNSEFFKPSKSENEGTSEKTKNLTDEGFNSVQEPYKRFRLNIDFNDTRSRQIVQTFHHTATEGFDRGLEIVSNSEALNDAYWVLDSIPFVAQAFNFDKKLEIPLIVKLKDAQSLRFRIVDIQNFNEDQAIYIEDIKTDTFYDLKSQNFEIDLEAGDYLNRFFIKFQPRLKTLEEVTLEEGIVTFMDNNSNELHINKIVDTKIESISMYNYLGQAMGYWNVNSIEREIIVPITTLATGAYLVQITTENGAIVKKIIVE